MGAISCHASGKIEVNFSVRPPHEPLKQEDGYQNYSMLSKKAKSMGIDLNKIIPKK